MSSAQEEQTKDQKMAGVPSRSAASISRNFILDFALMARKLRKGKGDKYDDLIERELAKFDICIGFLEQNPQAAKDWQTKNPEGDCMALMEHIEAKAADEAAEELYKNPIAAMKMLLPGYKLNTIVKDGKNTWKTKDAAAAAARKDVTNFGI